MSDGTREPVDLIAEAEHEVVTGARAVALAFRLKDEGDDVRGSGMGLTAALRALTTAVRVLEQAEQTAA